MKDYLNFNDDRRSDTDDHLFRQAAKESMISTLGGLFISILGMIIPVGIAFADLPMEVKVGAFGSGGITSISGSLISRFKPNVPEERSQDSSQVKEDF